MLEREYRDGDTKRAMMWQLNDNKRSMVIIDEKNKQARHINEDGGTCIVTDLSVINPQDYPFGGTNKANGKFLYSTEKVMKLVKKTVVMVNTKENVRGIDVQHWCADFSFKNRDFQINMYFAGPKWKTAGAYSLKPVRFVLTENSNSSDAIKHNYEYYTFFSKIKDAPMTVFGTPMGVMCKAGKGGKKIPKLPKYFSYRQETVYDEYVKISDVWYNEKDRLLRIDYRPGEIENGLSAAISEIHDYNTGVLYMKNLYYGNCSASTITNSSFGTEQNSTIWKKNKSYEVMMKNPLQYFYLDTNYVYAGKNLARQIQCDVFSSTRKSFLMPDGRFYPVVLDFYFAADDYEIMPDKSNNITTQVPVMLLVSTQDKSLAMEMRINIVDFNEKQHDFSIFDVSSCYSTAAKMHISILMDGQYVESTREEIIGEGQVMIADLMKIRSSRVQNIHMSHDVASISLYASILDRSPPAAQFSHISSKIQTVGGDATYKGVKTVADCSNKCVQRTDFVCNSFDICGNDCILSKTRIATKATDGGTFPCFHYSRTVDGPQIKEIGLKSAWHNLLNAIAQGQFLLEIPNDTGDSQFKALFARLDVGVILEVTNIPKLSINMKYKEEIVSPSDKTIQPISVYYDAPKNLTRFDGWYGCSFCSGPVATIQDFQLGVQYVIDKLTGECHSEHIQAKTFDVINGDPSKKKLLKMKDVMSLFYLDETYSFVGQKDVRGIMADIFESRRTDFAGKKEVLFRYHFLSKNWNPVGYSVPLKLEITSDVDQYNSVYNFFEFVQESVSMFNFDVTKCYRESNKVVDFQISFDGVYTQQSSNFIFAVINVIKRYTHVSGIRIQEPEIFYDSQKTYFQASLLEPPPSIAMFNKTDNMYTVVKPEKIVNNIKSPEDCADQCVKTKYQNCNAFQYCQLSQKCELHTKHFGDSHMKGSETCIFYTRTEDAPMDLFSAKSIMTDLINLVRKGIFKISFTVGERTYYFTARSVLTNIDRDNSRNIATVRNMESYNKSFAGAFMKQYTSIFMNVSVDDCAYKCTKSQTFNCEAFSYCYLQGQCVLSENHPTKDTIEVSSWCDVYERNYLNLFEELPGKTFPMQGEKSIADVTNPESCARDCYNEGVGSCQSFEYCKDLKACTFNKRHTMDVPSSDIFSSPHCSVYSLTFLKDFKKASTKIEKLVDNVLIKNVSVKQCARICLRDQGPDCASFDYCPSDKICRITGYDEVGGGQVSTIAQMNCSHFTRINKIQSTSFKIKKINGNKGTLAGLGIGMFILGSLLGVFLIYIIHKKGRSSKEDHMKVNFLKMEDQ